MSPPVRLSVRIRGHSLHTSVPAGTSTASSLHAVLQTHPDARPSQVHDPTGVADYWDHVVEPDTVHARLRALLQR